MSQISRDSGAVFSPGKVCTESVRGEILRGLIFIHNITAKKVNCRSV